MNSSLFYSFDLKYFHQLISKDIADIYINTTYEVKTLYRHLFYRNFIATCRLE